MFSCNFAARKATMEKLYKWLFMLIGLFLIMNIMLTYIGKAEAGEIKLRGVVEGFYGTPWSHEQRLDMIKFIASQGMNGYIYAPKDDDFHRMLWRAPYPADKYEELAELAKVAADNGVELIFAVSPGNDIAFSGEAMQADRQIMVAKLQAMYKIGIRHFALFFDDIPEKDAKGQAEFANWINKNFIKANKGCKPLMLVPTEYYLKDMIAVADGKVNAYTECIAAMLDKDIVVLHTGSEVCPDGVSVDDMSAVNKLYNRRTGLWLNYPVNDYKKGKLGLGPVDKLDKKLSDKNVAAFFINPMENPEMSKIAIATGASFALEPEKYDENKAWLSALQAQYGFLAEDMMIFASHSQRLENNWAHIGRQDARELQQEYKELWAAVKAHRGAEVREMASLLVERNRVRHNAISNLQSKLPENVLNECGRQLDKLSKMTDAEYLALVIMANQLDDVEANTIYQKFTEAMDEVKSVPVEVKISENAIDSFLNDFTRWYIARYGRR